MAKTGIFILTCNILTKKEEWLPVEFPKPIKINLEVELINEVKIVKKSRNLEKSKYYKKVWEITLANDLTEIMRGKERGFHKYHIDHILPISYGFKHGVPPEQIGHISNLRPLFWKDNFLKAAKVPQKVKEQILLL